MKDRTPSISNRQSTISILALGFGARRGRGGSVGSRKLFALSRDAPGLCLERDASEHDLRDHIRRTGTPDLTTDAFSKVTCGITSLDEALRMHSV